ncbi:diacylglycerol kinase family protein [Rhodoligotrophos defluvii]|uniref:diacylglycerol kinase family protein n=1 Tax=Rhodoligotrophos defluvii TaxID=2561934 RepID=UPI0010C948DD|nr:diacylglycerol kinase family protein [Rhodoligotrophos defluvii]
MTVGLIVNPASARGSGKGLALAHELAGYRQVQVRVLDRFAMLPDVLKDMAAAGVDTLFISSGDGTVQAIQTLLGEQSPFPKLPRLALLPHGTTNMNADDVGFRIRGIRQIAEMMLVPDRLARATAVKRRCTLRAANPANCGPQHGMFLGAGALAEAARQTQSQLNGRGIGGQIAPAMTLLRAISRFLLSAPAPDDLTRIDRAYPMDVFADGTLQASGDQLLLLVTTLDRLVLRSRPFWGTGVAPLRGTAICYPPPPLLRNIMPIMYAKKEDAVPPPGCVSFTANLVELEHSGIFLIDGEFFEAPTEGPLRIETGIELEYVCG